MSNEDQFNSRQVEFHKQDPLKDQDATRRELFGRMSKAANNFEQRDVVYAAVNLILNAIRQQCPKQKDAEAMFDELMAHGKRTLLDQHYFPSGQRRSVYPFHQVIEPPTIDARPKESIEVLMNTLRPSSDVVETGDGEWTDASDSQLDLYTSIDETSANDADYVRSPSHPTRARMKIKLSEPGGSPDLSDPVYVRARFRKVGPSVMRFLITLKQDNRNIAVWVVHDVDSDYVDFEETLTPFQLAAITDQDALYLELDAHYVPPCIRLLDGYTDGIAYDFSQPNGAQVALLDAVDPDWNFSGSLNAFQFPARDNVVFSEHYGLGAPKLALRHDGYLHWTPHNLLDHSQSFDDGDWTKSQHTITDDVIAAPDGTLTADLATSTTGSNYIRQGVTIVDNEVYTTSFYLKLGNNDWIRWAFEDDGTGAHDFRGWFNINTGTVGSMQDNGDGEAISIDIEDAGNGWYRCILTGRVNFDATACNVNIRPALADATSTLVEGATYYIWGAQINRGYEATEYIATDDDERHAWGYCYDGLRKCYGVLMEPDEINEVEFSEDFNDGYWGKEGATITPDATTDPMGIALNADLMVESTDDESHGIDVFLPFTGGDNYTLSVYAKYAGRYLNVAFFEDTGNHGFAGQFDLQNGVVRTEDFGGVAVGEGALIEPVGHGWYRCSVSGSIAGFSAGHILIDVHDGGVTETYAGDGVSGVYLWGAQFEHQPYATTLIPTDDAEVYRPGNGISGDYLMTGITTVRDDNAVYCDFRPLIDTDNQDGTTDQVAWNIDHALSDNNRIFVDINNGNFQARMKAVTASVTSMQWDMGAVFAGNRVETSTSFSEVEANWSVNGVGGDSDPGPFDLPEINEPVLIIGNNQGQSQPLFGWYYRFVQVGTTVSHEDISRWRYGYNDGEITTERLLSNEIDDYLGRFMATTDKRGGFAIDATVENGNFTVLDLEDDLDFPNVQNASFIDTAQVTTTFDMAGTPKFVHWPTSPYVRWTPHNYLLNSNGFASWDEVNENTITANFTTAPDGRMTAHRFVDTVVSDEHDVVQLGGITANNPYSLSAYIKQGASSFVFFSMSSAGTTQHYVMLIFNPSTGAVTQTGVGSTSGTIDSTNVETIGDSWYRVTLTGKIALGDGSFKIGFAPAASGVTLNAFGRPASYSGSGSTSFYVWAAQLNRGSIATPYRATTSSEGIGLPQGYDSGIIGVVDSAFALQIERGSANLIPYSQNITDIGDWTEDGSVSNDGVITAPDGTMTGCRITAQATNAIHLIYWDDTAVTTASSPVNLSVYLKAGGTLQYAILNGNDSSNNTRWYSATFDLINGTVTSTQAGAAGEFHQAMIYNVGDGWYRCTIQGETDSAFSSVNIAISNQAVPGAFGPFGDVTFNAAGTEVLYIWGVQMEDGIRFSTSYMPTYGATSDRDADEFSIPITQFSYQDDGDEGGGIMVEARMGPLEARDDPVGPTGTRIWQLNGIGGEEMALRWNESASLIQFRVEDGGVEQANIIDMGDPPSDNLFAVAVRWQTNEFQAAQDGNIISAGDASGTVPTVTLLGIGWSEVDSGGQPQQMFLRRLVYVPNGPGDDDLKELSSHENAIV